MIKIKNISFSYNLNKDSKKRPVLKNLNLEIKQGEFVALLGPSGCGKTTLVNILAGYLTPDDGEVMINNVVIKKPGKNRIVVNQENDLFDWMTVYQNMRIVVDDDLIISKFLRLTRLDKFRSDFPHNLSGGMKKRLSLARALSVNPKFLILDEPFSSLDTSTKDDLYLELNKIIIQTKKTIFFVTHDIDEAIFLADRIFILSKKPASIIKDIVVDFPRPRRLEVKDAHKFMNLKKNIKKCYV